MTISKGQLVIVSFGVVAFAWFLLSNFGKSITLIPPIAAETQYSHQSTTSNNKIDLAIQQRLPPNPMTPKEEQTDVKQAVVPAPTSTASEQIKNWKMERGTDLSSDPEYESYNGETLRTLGNSGDIRALAVLSNKYAGYPDEKSQRFAAAARMKAAMYGSTYATKQQAIRAMQLRINAKSDVERKNLLLEGMAWYKLGLLRGDPTYYFKEIESPTYVNEGIELNAKDFEKINEITHRIYSSLEASRNKIGLGNFDNSAPVAVADYFKEIDPRKNGVVGY